MNQNIDLSVRVKRNTLLLLMSTVAFSCVTQLILVMSGIIVQDLTGSTAQASLATGVVLGGDILVVYHAGKISDRLGRKNVLLIGIALAFFAMFLIVAALLSVNILFYWLGLLFFSFSTGFFVQNRAAISDMYPPNKRGQAAGYLGLATLIGSFLSTMIIKITIPIAEFTGLTDYTIIIIACIFMLTFTQLFIGRMFSDTIDFAKRMDHILISQNTEIKNKVGSKTTSRLLLIAVFLASSLGVGIMAITLSTVPLILHQNNVELSLISISVFVISLGSSGLSIPLGYMADKFGGKRLIIIGGLLMGIGASIIPITGSFIVINFVAFIVGMGASMITVASTALITDLTICTTRGKVFGANSVTANIASLVFPPLGAIFFLTAPFYLSILMVLVGFIIALSMTITRTFSYKRTINNST